jgi:hypothetical protein
MNGNRMFQNNYHLHPQKFILTIAHFNLQLPP